jgi:hypothetical protein
MAKQVEVWTVPAKVDLRMEFDPMSGEYRVEGRFLVRNPMTREWQTEEITAYYPLTLEGATDVLVWLAQKSRDAFVISEVEFVGRRVDVTEA